MKRELNLSERDALAIHFQVISHIFFPDDAAAEYFTEDIRAICSDVWNGKHPFLFLHMKRDVKLAAAAGDIGYKGKQRTSH